MVIQNKNKYVICSCLRCKELFGAPVYTKDYPSKKRKEASCPKCGTNTPMDMARLK